MSSREVTVVARIVALPGCGDELKAELLRLVPSTRQETGCIAYTLHQDKADPEQFLFYETWAGPLDLEAHLSSPHFQRYAAAVGPLLREKDVRLLTRIA